MSESELLMTYRCLPKTRRLTTVLCAFPLVFLCLLRFDYLSLHASAYSLRRPLESTGILLIASSFKCQVSVSSNGEDQIFVFLWRITFPVLVTSSRSLKTRDGTLAGEVFIDVHKAITGIGVRPSVLYKPSFF